MYALIMAGGRASRLGAGEKALTRIRDRPLIAYTLDAVRQAGLDPVVIVSPMTPYTANYCRIHGIDWLCTSGTGYVEDLHEAVKDLEINEAVLTVCVDLPGISPEHISKIIERYHSLDCEACSVWIPYQTCRKAGVTIPEGDISPNIPGVPVGLNIIRGDLIDQEQQEEKILIDDLHLTLNINTKKDLINAEKLLFSSPE